MKAIDVLGITVLFFAVSLHLTGCGDGVTPNLSKQAEIQDRETLLGVISKVVGTYSGTVKNNPDGSEDFPISLELYTVEEPNGVNEAGEAKFRPSLRGRYRRTDFPLDGTTDKSLSGRYYQENGVVTLFSSNTQTEKGYVSITANFIDNQLKGQLRNQQGVQGDFTLVRK